ncbi:S-layer homology domain-containing protein (plasmid) [Sporosarcina psychrophila]|uniref:S-layer homology domain-containing protein n=1 Tax=Sporosarcina psychrophila TaxID=1476 RepID=UPI0030D15249
MKNKLFIATLAFAVTIPAIIVPVQAEAVVKTPFKDVTTKSPYYDIIHTMRDQGIVSGFEDGTFRANESISRKHAAALVSRAKKLPAVKPFVKFKDVSESNTYFNDIKKLQQAGIFVADAKGNLNPNQPITRAEMAKILAIAFDLKGKAGKDFPDVPKSHSAYDYVSAIYANEVTTGDNGVFKPDAPLTRAHYAVFMYRAMNHKSTPLELDSLTEVEMNALTNEQILNELDMYRYKHGENVPLPKGQTDRTALTKKGSKEFNTYFVQNGLDRTSSTPLISRDSIDVNLKSVANIIQKSLVDVIKMHNHVVKTGEIITNSEDDPVKFAMYFNYEENRFYFAFRMQ